MRAFSWYLVWAIFSSAAWKSEATFQQHEQQQQQQQQLDFSDLKQITTTVANIVNNNNNNADNTPSSTNEGSDQPNEEAPSHDQGKQQQQSTSPPDAQTGGCTMDLPQAAECLKTAALDMISSFFFFVFDQNIENLIDDVCWKFPQHEQCVHQSLGSCGGHQRIKYDVALAAFNFVCSSTGRLAIQEAWPCLADRSVGQHLRVCSQQIATATAFSNPCLTAAQYVNCVSITFQQRCTSRAANAVRDLLLATLRPYNTFFQCPPAGVFTTLPPPPPTTASTTVASTDVTSSDTVTTIGTAQDGSPVQCHDCTTGARGLWENPDCTAEGKVNQVTVPKVTCLTPCFARVSKGAVTRGCSTGYNGTFLGKFDLNDCVTLGTEINMEVWCFCAGTSGCNVQDMTSRYNEFIP